MNKGYDYDPKEKKMVSKKNKSSSDKFKCYNYVDLGHMKRDFPEPKKKSNFVKGRPRRKFGNKWKSFQSIGQALVGKWVIDDEGEEDDDEDNEEEEA